MKEDHELFLVPASLFPPPVLSAVGNKYVPHATVITVFHPGRGISLNQRSSSFVSARIWRENYNTITSNRLSKMKCISNADPSRPRGRAVLEKRIVVWIHGRRSHCSAPGIEDNLALLLVLGARTDLEVDGAPWTLHSQSLLIVRVFSGLCTSLPAAVSLAGSCGDAFGPAESVWRSVES